MDTHFGVWTPLRWKNASCQRCSADCKLWKQKVWRKLAANTVELVVCKRWWTIGRGQPQGKATYSHHRELGAIWKKMLFAIVLCKCANHLTAVWLTPRKWGATVGAIGWLMTWSRVPFQWKQGCSLQEFVTRKHGHHMDNLRHLNAALFWKKTKLWRVHWKRCTDNDSRFELALLRSNGKSRTAQIAMTNQTFLE